LLIYSINMIKRISFFIVLILCLSSGVVAQKNNEAVTAALAKYDAAWNKKDRKGVDAVLHPSYMYFSSEGGMTSRRKTLEFLVSPKYMLTFVERSEISTFGTDNTVIVSSRWKGKGTYNDQPVDDDQRCSLVFTKVGKYWKLLSEHCTQIVSK
jgi:ketosteroid isomerase-like protein